MKTILKIFCIIYTIASSLILCMEDTYSLLAKENAARKNPKMRALKRSESPDYDVVLQISPTHSNTDSEEEDQEEENYNFHTESGKLYLCEIIRNNGCRAAFNLLKDLKKDQIDVTLAELDGTTALKESLSRYGSNDTFATRLLVKLLRRGAKLDSDDEAFLKSNSRGKLLLEFIREIKNLEKLAKFEEEDEAFFKKWSEGKKKEEIKQQAQNISKRGLFKYLIFGSIGICVVYLFYKLNSKQKKSVG